MEATFEQLIALMEVLKGNDERALKRIIELEKKVEALEHLMDSIHPGWS